MMQSEEFHCLIFLRHVNQRMMQFKMFDLYFHYPFVFFMLQFHLNNKSQDKFFFFLNGIMLAVPITNFYYLQ